jgi:hypothetical protein
VQRCTGARRLLVPREPGWPYHRWLLQAAQEAEQAKVNKMRAAALAQRDVQMQQLEAVKARILAER